jgi:anti-sigma B factor antagonist
MTTFRTNVEETSPALRSVSVAGELDQATAPQLSEALQQVIDGGKGAVLVDLSDCEFIDSTGLAVLVHAREELTAADGRDFAICCPNSQVRRLLEITGIDTAMGMFDTRDEALAALGAEAS